MIFPLEPLLFQGFSSAAFDCQRVTVDVPIVNPKFSVSSSVKTSKSWCKYYQIAEFVWKSDTPKSPWLKTSRHVPRKVRHEMAIKNDGHHPCSDTDTWRNPYVWCLNPTIKSMHWTNSVSLPERWSLLQATDSPGRSKELLKKRKHFSSNWWLHQKKTVV